MNRLFEDVEGARVLAFGAHPDDVEVGAGGLVARLASEGAQVTICVVSVPTLREERVAEAAEAARLLGAKLELLYPERQHRVEDVPMYELVSRFDRLVGDYRPELVITHAADDLHWDHGLVHRATISAMRRTPADILAFRSSFEMNAQSRAIGACFADISSTIETKLQAVRAHKTQLPKMDVDSTRDLARAMGRLAGVSYAEAYEVLRLRI